jgi:diguanylate cyclase (GGDEF)-like protein
MINTALFDQNIGMTPSGMTTRIPFCVLILFIVSASCQSASLVQALKNKKNFTSNEGLVQNTVYDIEQDLNGFIWLATQSGLDRFDGYSFENFGETSDIHTGLSGLHILDLELDKSTGDLWVGTASGLNKLDAVTGNIETINLKTNNGEPHKRFPALHFDKAGSLWVVAGSTLYVQNKITKTFTSVPFHTEFSRIFIHELETDEQNVLFIASSNGLLRYDINRGKWLPTLLKSKIVLSVFIDHEQALWVGTNSEGLFHFTFDANNSPLNTVQVSTKQGLANNIVYDIEQSSSGTIWVATNKGVSIFPNYKKENALLPMKLNNAEENNDSGSIVYSLFVDNADQILFGTLINGFSVVSPKAILFNNLSIGTTRLAYSTELDNQENLWITAPEGLWKIDARQQTRTRYEFEKGDVNADNANILLDIFHSTFDDTLWVSTRVGLARLNRSKTALITVGFKGIPIYSLAGDGKGNLYVGTTTHGFYHYNPINQEILSHYDTDRVLGIHVSDEEKVWLATSEGIVKINPIEKTKEVYLHTPNDPNSLAHNVVTWISDKSDGQYLVATQAKGVQLMEEDSQSGTLTFTSIFPETELSKVSIGAIREGVNGNYWISTINGIVKMDKTLSVLEFYDNKDGASRGGYFISANSMNSKGQIFFAGSDGVTYFHPDNIVRPKSFPSLHITRISILNNESGLREINAQSTPIKPIKNTSLNIDYNDILFTVDIAATELISPENIQYAYRLLGFNNQWLTLDSTKRSITYTSLDPGSYTLEVKSTDRYGNFNRDQVVLKIEVKPPWYATKIAVISWVVLGILSIYLYAKWRAYEQFSHSEKLAEEVANKTKELKLANEQLQTLSNQDPLTKVYNRRGFTYFANKQLQIIDTLNEASAVMLFDIDFFKRINDNFGHSAGDEILLRFATIIQSHLKNDDMVGRWGGEEFVLLLPKADMALAIKVANDIRVMVSEKPVEISGQSIKVTVSGGVAIVKHSDSLDESIKKADVLLYEAKQNGRNQICY